LNLNMNMNHSEGSEPRFLDALDGNERAELLASLDEADREIDEGRGCSADGLRRAVREWASRLLSPQSAGSSKDR
jgi:hypothetical protein